MAGRGPAPKNPGQRARRNKDVAEVKAIVVSPATKPELPTFSIVVATDGMIATQEFKWPEQTVEWWDMLSHHPLVHEFSDLDWSYLLETARIHAAFWFGDLKQATELRLREAKYGFTPEDRLRLRWQVATTVGAEADAAAKLDKRPSARERYGQTKAIKP